MNKIIIIIIIMMMMMMMMIFQLHVPINYEATSFFSFF